MGGVRGFQIPADAASPRQCVDGLVIGVRVQLGVSIMLTIGLGS